MLLALHIGSKNWRVVRDRSDRFPLDYWWARWGISFQWRVGCHDAQEDQDQQAKVLALLHAATLARALRPRTCATVRSTLRMVGRALDGRDCAEDAPNPRGFAEKRFEAVQLAAAWMVTSFGGGRRRWPNMINHLDIFGTRLAPDRHRSKATSR